MDALEIYKRGCELATNAINADSKEEYMKNVNELKKIQNYIHDIIITLIGADIKLYIIFVLFTNMKTLYSTSQKLPLDLIINKHNIKISFNPLSLAVYSLHELKGYYIMEANKILLKHLSWYSKLNQDGDINKHNILERASMANICETLRNDILIVNTKTKIPRASYTKSVMLLECNKPSTNGYNDSIDGYYKFINDFLQNNNTNSPISVVLGNNDPAYNKMLDTIDKYENNNDNIEHNVYNMQNADSVDELLDITIKDTIDKMNNKQRSTMPSIYNSIVDLIIKPKKPEIKWQRDLINGIGSTPVNTVDTRSKLNRLNINRFDLPGSMDEYICDVVCIFDISGSMSDIEIKAAINEVYNISKQWNPKITVIQCDTDVKDVIVITTKNDINKFKRAGSGGTAFTPAIEYVNDNNFKNAISIYFTDGYGERSVPKIKTRKHIWVITNAKNNADAKSILSVEKPQGSVRALKLD